MMRYKRPALEWQEAFPIGNGRLGAMVYADPVHEVLQINEDTIWSGYPEKEETGMNRDAIEKAKKLAKARCYEGATHVLEEALLDAEQAQMYEPFGRIHLDFLEKGKQQRYTAGEEEQQTCAAGEEQLAYTDYERILDLEKAVVSVRYRRNGAAYEHTCFASAPGQAIVYRIRAEEAFSIRISGEGDLLRRAEYKEGKMILKGQCSGRENFSYLHPVHGVEDLHFSTNPEEQGMLLEGWGKVSQRDGVQEEKEDGIYCLDTHEIILRIVVRTSFNGFDKHPVMEGKNPAAQLEQDMKLADRSFETLYQEHVEDYQRYFSRVKLQLGHTDETKERMDLRERLAAYATDPTDTGLCTLLFDYGRYLLISSSRPGTQPANLQGIWNKEIIPPWNCDYTTNINVQMNYWMTGVCNLAELCEPLAVMNEELLLHGKRCAEAFYGLQGSLCFHNTDIWRKASPAPGLAKWGYWQFGGAWMCRNLYENYAFNQDLQFLKKIYPILKENAVFCLESLEMTKDGWAVVPATSPENDFIREGQEMVSAGIYTENTLAIIRNLFRDFVAAWEILEREVGSNSAQVCDADLVVKIKEVLPQIAGTQIGSQGQILEWNEEMQDTDPNHRHLSHLYDFHPGNGITDQTPALKEAVKKSLLMRGDEGTGWSLAWKVLMWARMEDGEHAGAIVRNLFRLVEPEAELGLHGGGLYPNLFCAHPPFQIDGNFGYTAGVAEMLLQSHAGEIVILPAIPKEWKKKGSVSGLRARGGITVDISWNEEEIVCGLTALKDMDVKVRFGKETVRSIKLTGGQRKELRK